MHRPSRTETDRGVRHYGSDDQIDPNHLVAGTTARRYTEPAPGGQLDVAVPCCGRTARLPHIGHQLRTAVGCPFCTLLYTVTLIDELDGGYAALFTIHDEPIVLARRRRPRRSG
jgi:hypothetical protein